MNRQSGISMMGFVGLLIVLGSIAFVVMRLFPVYSEHHSVVTAMKGLAADPESAGQDVGQIRKMLAKRLQISYVENVKPENIRITRQDGGYLLVVSYEVRRPLVYNLDFVAKFEDEVPLRKGDRLPD